MRRTLPLATAALLVAACASSNANQPASPAPAAAPAPPAKPSGALAASASILGDWKRDGGESHYVFAGDAILGVSFAGDGFEVSITTAEPDVKTRAYKDGAAEVVSDGAPSLEGASKIETPRAADVEKAESEFAEATAARGIHGWLDWFDEHGAEWDRGDASTPGHRVEGKQAIEAFMGPQLSAPGAKLKWAPLTSGLSPSGQLAYTVGNWQFEVNGQIKVHGAFVTVWKHQADGSWKVLFDTGDPAAS